jgi:hypothetical protein
MLFVKVLNGLVQVSRTLVETVKPFTWLGKSTLHEELLLKWRCGLVLWVEDLETAQGFRD